MNKKLLAVAVAGALAAPGVALAQASSVTISGFFKVGVENINYGSAGQGRLNSSQTRVQDNSSRMLFNSTEDLGNGLSAVGQLDLRFTPNSATATPTSNPIGSGNTWVGLASKSWGRITVGRHDLHYGKAPDDTAAKAGALEAAAISLFDYIGSTVIANGSRTQNVVRYDMPNINGLDATVAWSSNPVGNQNGDMVCAGGAAATSCTAAITNPPVLSNRRGDGWNINPQYTNGPFQIGYDYWRARPDFVAASGTAAALSVYSAVPFDQRGDSVYGYYKFGGFKVGLGWNKSRLETSASGQIAGFGSGAKVGERTAWTLPMSYVWGPHNVVGHYTRTNNISSDTGTYAGTATSARMIAIAYVYDLSKRTSLGLTYAKINNDANINYNFFTSTSFGGTDTAPINGESPRLLQATIKHMF